MAHDAAAVLKQVKNLEDFRVLMALLEQLDYENLITTNQAEIAEAGHAAAERTAEHQAVDGARRASGGAEDRH